MNRVGNYQLIKPLGQGGMGAIYLGQDVSTHEEVAIKVVRSDFARELTVISRFKHEIAITRKFSHPYVVKVIDGGYLKEDNTLYFVMEYLPGQDLQQIAVSSPIDGVRGLAIMKHMASALDYIHQNNVIHRDVKVENIFIVSDDRTVLLDFGLALDDDLTRISKTADRPGSVITMSPEQLMGKDLDGRTDIFSLGVSIYWALTGKIPYDSQDFVKLYSGGAVKSPPPVSELNSTVSREFSDIIAKSMALSLDDRFQDAKALGKAIDFVASAKASTTTGGRRRPGAPPKVVTSSRPEGVEQGVSSKNINSQKLVVFGAAIVLLLALLLFFGLFSDSQLEYSFQSISTSQATIRFQDSVKDLSHIATFSEGKKVGEISFGSRQSTGEKGALLTVNGLQPAHDYVFEVVHNDGTVVAQGQFRTRDVFQNVTIEKISLSSVDVRWSMNVSGEADISLGVFPVLDGTKSTQPEFTLSVKKPYRKGEEQRIHVEKLNPMVMYVFELTFISGSGPEKSVWTRTIEGTAMRLREKRLAAFSDLGGLKYVSADSVVRVNSSLAFLLSKGRGVYLCDMSALNVLKKIEHPGITTHSLSFTGKCFYCLQSASSQEGSRYAKLTLKAYSFPGFSLQKSLDVSFQCMPSFLRVFRTCALLWEGSDSGRFICYSLEDGKELWRGGTRPFPEYVTVDSRGTCWTVPRRLRGSDGIVERTAVKGIDVSSGALRYKVSIEGTLEATPLELNSKLALFLNKGRIKTIDTTTGEELQVLKLGGDIISAGKKQNLLGVVLAPFEVLADRQRGTMSPVVNVVNFSGDFEVNVVASVQIPPLKDRNITCWFSDRRMYYGSQNTGIHCVKLNHQIHSYSFDAQDVFPFEVFWGKAGLTFLKSGTDLFQLTEE